MREELYAMATSVARGLAKRWREDYEDIRQEILLAALKDDLDASWEDVEALEKDDYKDLASKTRRWMKYAGERYCRREKAARDGYDVSDEVFYSKARLEQLLEWLFAVGLEERPPIGRSESVSRSTGDPAEGGGHLASLLDVQRGLDQLHSIYIDRLKVRFGLLAGYSDDQIAAMSQSEIRHVTGWHHERLRQLLGDTGDQVRHRVDTALRRLQWALGGMNPWNRGPMPTVDRSRSVT
ncbi:hypothetical protein AB0C33_02040 [Nonomuraea sp. NPDC048881]|uniref:hypothetical protein n=1 Tax=Nonomuraea sp. NPDC048881 TaxID=3155030 RepID=UPI0033E50248